MPEERIARLDERMEFLTEVISEVKADVKTLLQGQTRCTQHEERISSLEKCKDKSVSFGTAVALVVISSCIGFAGSLVGGYLLALLRKHSGI